MEIGQKMLNPDVSARYSLAGLGDSGGSAASGVGVILGIAALVYITMKS
jgi:hypothetical protein